MAGVDCAVNTVAGVAVEIVKSAARQARYCFCFSSYVEDFEKQKRELETNIKSVHDRAEIVKRENKKLDVKVEEWLRNAEALTEEVVQLKEKTKTNNSSCVGWCCRNWIQRYPLVKKLEKKRKEMVDHNGKSNNLESFALPAPTLGMSYYNLDGFIYFESTKLAYEQLLKALEDDKVSMIGLYGMGGCGKSTLAKAIGKEVEKKHFKKVAFVVVSGSVDDRKIKDVQKIQGSIASELDLEFKPDQDEVGRAKSLWLRLTSGEKTLLILDDVWQRLNFEAIGIPFGSTNHKEFKVLLTTRSMKVCTSIGCQETIPLSLLTENEALPLFQTHAGITDNSSDSMKSLAEKIVKECKGLPIAIKAVGSALKGKSEGHWKSALGKLTNSEPIDIEGGSEQDPYRCLQLSYEYLRDENAENLFLLCCLFPEDFKIPVEDLIRYAIGLGLVKQACSYEGKRNQEIEAIDKLRDSCLLLEVDAASPSAKQCVKMHDLVRDVGLWIAKKENKLIKCVSEEDVSMEDSPVRYLWCDGFPNQLNRSNLEFLRVSKGHFDEIRIPDEFFEEMKKLRVLVVRYHLPIMPPFLELNQSLTNLCCLILNGCKIHDISVVGNISTLESLTLRTCSFNKLLKGIIQLRNLRLLEVSYCHIYEDYDEDEKSEVNGRCSQLEELYISTGGHHRMDWDVKTLDKFLTPQTLQRYRIDMIGYNFNFDFGYNSISRGLRLNNFDASVKSNKDLVQSAEVLLLENIKEGYKNIVPDMIKTEEGLNELIELGLSNCGEMECLVDTSSHLYREKPIPSVFEKLEKLRLHSCNQLHGSLFVGELKLCNLKLLTLEDCEKLQCVFTPVVAKSLVLLEELRIERCPSLKHIIMDEKKGEIDSENDDESNYGSVLPKLKRFVVVNCHELNLIYFTRSLIVQLETFKIQDFPNVDKYRIDSYMKCEDLSQSESSKDLDPLDIESNKSVNIGVSHLPIDLPHIKKIQIGNIELEAIFQIDNEADTLKSCLEKLHLARLKELKCIFKGPTKSMSLQNLQKLKIYGCKQIKSIFSASIAEGLPKLELLEIGHCDELEEIIEDKEHQHCSNLCMESYELKDKQNPKRASCASHIKKLLRSCATAKDVSPVNFRQLRQNSESSFNLCNLKELMVQSCPKLNSLLTLSMAKTLTSLEEVMIKECHGLTCVISHEKRKEEVVEDDHNLQTNSNLWFPKLKEVYVEKCNSLEYMLPVSFARGLVELTDINISWAPQLKYVFGESNLEEYSSHQYSDKIQIELPALDTLKFEGTPNMIGFFPINYHARCSPSAHLSLNYVASIQNLMDVGQLAMNSSHMINAVSQWITQLNVNRISVQNSFIEGIFKLGGSPTKRELDHCMFKTSCLRELHLNHLSELFYI